MLFLLKLISLEEISHPHRFAAASRIGGLRRSISRAVNNMPARIMPASSDAGCQCETAGTQIDPERKVDYSQNLCSGALQGESLAVREALGLAIARSWDKADFETYSSIVANAVSSHTVSATWEIHPNR
ncbi:hypothetical protein OIU79_004984 [Salix purpurea]|uniref:Uncharacterized protein n=1 Tax=Salix purpurea TaxID=77065 RepID=A0A9Q0ZA73_SALPP|nr:hypothetical protein OIU79_004984 [Salix purpurea]